VLDHWFKAEVSFACTGRRQGSSKVLIANASRQNQSAVFALFIKEQA